MSHRPNRTDGPVPSVGTRALIGNLSSYQMSNVQRSSRSGLKCQCVGSDIDSTDVRIPSPVRLNDLGRWIGTLVGGANFIHGATGIIWLTGVSISLNAVSGLSAMGTTEMKMTAVTRRSRNIHSVRFTTATPIAWNLTASPVRCQPLPDSWDSCAGQLSQPMGCGEGSTPQPLTCVRQEHGLVVARSRVCQVVSCPIATTVVTSR